VLHEVAGYSMLEHVVRSAVSISPASLAVVSSLDLSQNASLQALSQQYNFQITLQAEQLGTAHAVLCGMNDGGADDASDVLILFGDVPLLHASTLERMSQEHTTANRALTVLGFRHSMPNDYGKLILKEQELVDIVEAKNGAQETDLCNSGIMLVSSALLKQFLSQMKKDEISGEYYLTSIVEFAAQHKHCIGLLLTDAEKVMGVNDKIQLAAAEQIMQARLRNDLMMKGVKFIAPETIFLTPSVTMMPDVVVHPYVVFGKNVSIGAGSEILSFSHIAGVKIGANCTIGPFARIRPESSIEANSRVGNFVEIKQSVLGSGTKAGHLSYIGDVTTGREVNIGAGAVFCNYDGVTKHRSTVGDQSFIGANSSIVSPVSLGTHSKIGAGSVITMDVPDQYLAVARVMQKNLLRKEKKV
jgi:bifunctional UDP-N-acetylglucosamine pyrophosphorylase / glucosamine-1-phosphate N-acetyltransferase